MIPTRGTEHVHCARRRRPQGAAGRRAWSLASPILRGGRLQPSIARWPVHVFEEHDYCYGNGVVLDLTHKAAGDEITVPDIEAAEKKLGGYTIKALDIVLLRTDAAKKRQCLPRSPPLETGNSAARSTAQNARSPA